jgi:uncharacterized protein YqeY
MGLKNTLKDAVKDAMRAKDKVKLETLRIALSVIQYEEISKGELADEPIVQILKSEIKKRKESIEIIEKTGRADSVPTIKEEIAALEVFLPKQLSSTELEKILTDMKAANPATNMGVAMKELKEKYPGLYDAKVASELAKKLL